MYWLSVGCKGGAEIVVEIRELRSSPKVGSGTNHSRSFGNDGGFPKLLAVSACFWLALSQRFDGTMGRCCPSDRMDEIICKTLGFEVC